MSKTRGKPKTMTEALREALADRDATLRTVSGASGVPLCSLSRFLAGKQSLRLDMADRLAVYFGVEVRPPRRGSRKKGKTGG